MTGPYEETYYQFEALIQRLSIRQIRQIVSKSMSHITHQLVANTTQNPSVAALQSIQVLILFTYVSPNLFPATLSSYSVSFLLKEPSRDGIIFENPPANERACRGECDKHENNSEQKREFSKEHDVCMSFVTNYLPAGWVATSRTPELP